MTLSDLTLEESRVDRTPPVPLARQLQLYIWDSQTGNLNGMLWTTGLCVTFLRDSETSMDYPSCMVAQVAEQFWYAWTYRCLF